MGIAWRAFQVYGFGYRYRLGTHHRGRHSYEVVSPNGKAIHKGGFASAFDARKAAFDKLRELTKDERGAA